MKYKVNSKLSFTSMLAVAILLSFTNCEREISEDAVLATYPNTPDIFTDVPVGLTDAFFESFDPATGANPTGFGTDNDVAYVGNSSIRIDVPAPNDPDGGYIGGIFRDRGAGRNLTSYDALTFWAKGSITGSIGTVGFGVDFGENKHQVTADNIQLSTDWRKYVIPIPDASKLVQERGMFIFSAGTQNTNGVGFTIWIDELRFEKLGNTNLLYPFIFNGEDRTVDGFLGSTQVVNQFGALFNLANGQNVTVNAAPAYFSLMSSNTAVTGPFTQAPSGDFFTNVIGSTGTAVITAKMGNYDAQGSLTINAVGDFDFAPTPTVPASNVLSVFSDFYTNVPVTYYNGFWTPGSTTGSADFVINGDNILNYTNFNYVGIAMANPTLNASAMTRVHFNMYIPNSIPPNFSFLISIEDWGPNQIDNGGDDTRQQIFVNASQVQPNTWITIDQPLTLANRNNIGLIIFENINGSTLSNFYLDNIYFYTN